MRIVTVIGARPQFVKACPVSAVLRSSTGVEERVIHTGQHFDNNMSAIFFEELGMQPAAVNLGIHGGTHGEMTGAMLAGIERVLMDWRPDVTLVYGDTNSTLAGALAAAKLHIPVAHVEAGLRSFNRRMPEEVNRVLTDHLSSWLFTPTDTGRQNLQREGIDDAKIYKVGDVMYDVALAFLRRAEAESASVVDRLSLRGESYLLVTIHRPENTDSPERLRVIVQAIRTLAERYRIVWPVHPRTRNALDAAGLLDTLRESAMLLEPQGYGAMALLERHAAGIVTDSGGIQKEAFFHRVPCITLRDETEWTELITLGWNRLAPPTSVKAVIEAVVAAIGTVGQDASPYGDGNAAAEIAHHLLNGHIEERTCLTT